MIPNHSLTFSKSDGNLEGELTSERKPSIMSYHFFYSLPKVSPSKSSRTVLGERMSEWASIIRVSPRFLPCDNYITNFPAPFEELHIHLCCIASLSDLTSFWGRFFFWFKSWRQFRRIWRITELRRSKYSNNNYIQMSRVRFVFVVQQHFVKILILCKSFLPPMHWRCNTCLGLLDLSWKWLSNLPGTRFCPNHLELHCWF